MKSVEDIKVDYILDNGVGTNRKYVSTPTPSIYICQQNSTSGFA